MDGSNIEKLRDELTQLMQERIESMKNRTFFGNYSRGIAAGKAAIAAHPRSLC